MKEAGAALGITARTIGDHKYRVMRAPQPSVAKGEGVVELAFLWSASGVVPVGKRLYVVEQAGGRQRVRILNRSGRPLGVVPLAEASAVYKSLRRRGEALLLHSGS